MAMTIEARGEFVRGCTGLSIWFARHLKGRGIPLREGITMYTNVYRFTTLWDEKNHPANPAAGWRDEKWEGVLDRLEEMDGRYGAGDAGIEAEGLEMLWPLMEGRVVRDVETWPKAEERPFGFFSYRAGDRGWEEGRVTLHLANPFVPASPFADMKARGRELMKLIGDARRANPGIKTVFCASWLVSFEPFLALFPPEFKASRSEPLGLAYHLGWWGQMIDRRGGFHAGNGEYLRRTGEFRYACVAGECGVTEC